MSEVITPAMWDDADFANSAIETRIAWLWLLTGPLTSGSVPGLMVAGPAVVAEGARISVESARKALDDLRALEFIDVDERARLIRIPNAPRYKGCGAVNVVRGWFRRWKAIPESRLKYEHVASLESVCTPKWSAAWAETFGSEETRKTIRKGSRSIPNDHHNDHSDENPTPITDHRDGPITGSGSVTVTATGSASDSDSDVRDRDVATTVTNSSVLAVTSAPSKPLVPRETGGSGSPTEVEARRTEAEIRQVADDVEMPWSDKFSLLRKFIGKGELRHVLEFFAEQYRANYDEPYTGDGSLDHHDATTLLVHGICHGGRVAEVLRRIEIAFRAPPFGMGNVTLRAIVRRWPELVRPTANSPPRGSRKGPEVTASDMERLQRELERQGR